MQQSEDSGRTHESTKISQSSEGVIQPSSSQPSLKDHITQEQKKRCEQILKSFKKVIQAFQETNNNKFTVVNPPLWVIVRLNEMWMSRPQKNIKYTITLQLKNVDLGQHTDRIIEGLFMAVGSLKLIVNEKEVKLKAIFCQHGNYTYEGFEEKMNVFSQYHKTDFFGQVKKISEGDYRYHGKGSLVSGTKKDGFEYIGQFDNGKRHGEGLMKMRMSLYQGEFKNDFMHGKGRETIFKLKKKNVAQPTFIKQFIYEGNFKEGYRHGYGQQIKNGKYSFRGNWQRGVKCGPGRIEYNNQDTYEGEWENNLFKGKGIYVEKGNCVYEGEFKDGRYHGKGVMSYYNGDRYEGEFEYGKKHGQGKYDWKEKNDQQDYYDGMWKNDSAEGPGTSMIKGQFYNGEFKNGKRNGEGQLNTLEGDYIRAIFDQGEIVRYIQKNGQIVDQ